MKPSWISLRSVAGLAAIGLIAAKAYTQTPSALKFNGEVVSGPAKAADFPAWLDAMKAWRKQELSKIQFNPSNYNRPALKWAQSSFIQPQMMIEDRYFYDPRTRSYTLKRYLDDLKKRYGGIDSVLIWPTYPNIGIDDRNTDDMFRSMPGGIPALKKMVQDFKSQGVRVLFPIHPWDIGTRDPGKPWGTVLPATMAEIGADGMNGDTMDAVTKDYFDNSVADGDPLALEPEIGLSADHWPLSWNVMSWGYWDVGGLVPAVSLNKWLEPRHMVNICDRWSTNKTDLIQYAFFNGCGVETWENIWGIWNQMTDRDAEAVRRIAIIERAYSDLLMSPGWEPHTPTENPGSVFASKWPTADGKTTLWTLVNRKDVALKGAQLRVAGQPEVRYFDLWNGNELTPKDGLLSFSIEARGYGAVLAVEGSGAPPVLGQMNRLARKPLGSFSSANPVLLQKMTAIHPTRPATTVPEGMISIPAAQFEFVVKGIEIEGEDLVGVDVQYPWDDVPRRSHKHSVSISAFCIDKFPVTNADFKKFLDATRYKPADSQNFLKDWIGGNFPQGWEKKPVTWVSLEDARAYAAWAGKRLPHEWEWQYAAQGTDGRAYPWGNTMDPAQIPAPVKTRSGQPPADVDASTGASPFGVRDLVGNVWQWTDEFTDDHTRAAILRGGSRYQPQGSMWYFPQAYRLDQHGKYLLMAPAKDRSASVGFRCVVDSE